MMRVAAGVVMAALALALPATAEDAAPGTSVPPPPRPEEAPAAPVPEAPMPEAPVPEAPVPAAPAPAQVAPQPADGRTDTVENPSAPKIGKRDLLRLSAAENTSCLASLRDKSVAFEEVAAIVPDDDADCGILQPIKVSMIAPGIKLDPPAVMRCPTAQALAAWVQDFVVPAASRLDSRGALTAIENGSDYMCRRRNNLADGALSEHAFGNAFDVMGFRFAKGPPVVVGAGKTEDSLANAFEDAVRAAACLDFATVLGPGSSATHENHLHLDVMARTNGFRLCELQGTVP